MKALMVAVLFALPACGALPVPEAMVTNLLNERLVSLDARLAAGEDMSAALDAEVDSLKSDAPAVAAQAAEEAVAKIGSGGGVTKTEGLVGIGITLLSLIFRHRIGGFMGKLVSLVPDDREE